ncbi:MAG: response regulator [Candidatus Latescibacteria bacterium]|nr:response regulator [Candidatus Latescibacterota bacterium]MBT5829634.1 response regulator [Candidatus Latescibacterota bacterium]
MAETEFDLRDSRILVIDDEPDNLDLLCRALESAHYAVQIATSGEKGFALAMQSHPDLILLDVMMSGIDGYETCRRLKAQEITQDIPVIFLTGLDTASGVVEGFRTGGVDYVHKPFQKEEVLIRVQTHLERAQLIKASAQKRQALSELNAALEEKVAQRTQALQTKFEELEKRDQTAQHLLGVFKLHQTLKVLAATPLFQSLDETMLRDLTSELDSVFLPGGERLIQQGDVADALYVILNGRLRVVVEQADGQETAVAELGQGECVGEMAVLTEETRSASIDAIRDSNLVKLSKDGFNRFKQHNPQIVELIIQLLIQRIHNQNQQSTTRKANTGISVALVASGSDVSLTQFAAQLSQALSQTDTVLHLNASRLDDYLGKGMSQTSGTNTKNQNIVAWLNEQEINQHIIVYETDADASAWTLRCLRQADMVFIVGKVGSNPEPGLIEKELLKKNGPYSAIRKELIILHPDHQQPTDTGKWLAPREVVAHHHMRLTDSRDFERLARVIRGQTIGLVLSGGAARGFAHIGVIQALKERNIPIDVIGGTSMGAVVGAQYALGLDFDTMVEMNQKGWHDRKPFTAYTFPMVALLNDQKFNAMFKAMFDDVQIEDLWLPYFCLSSNLTQAKEQIYSTGPLWKSVRASASVPGALPPVFDGGDVYVDGAVLNNLPTEVMRQLCDGYVIASDVSVGIEMETRAPDYENVSGWKLLFKRLSPFAQSESLPSLIDVTMRSAELSSVKNTGMQRQKADFFLRPPVTTFDRFDWHIIKQIAEAGYTYATKEVADWDLVG